MDNSILEVRNLTKKFKDFTAVHDISFSLKKGEVLGLLGPNGAGKTTTIHMLLGITQTTNGTIKYFGKDLYSNRRYCLQRVNFASAFNTLQGRISIWENLLVFANLYRVKNPRKKIMDFVEYFEITDMLSTRYWDLSAGQKTRVNLIKALINDPEIILMDEPTASLDPDIADKTLSLIEMLKKSRNISLLYTSHNMDEITRVCDRVIFLDHGRIVAEDSPLGLTKRISRTQLRLIFDGDKNTVKKYLKDHNQKYALTDNNLVIISTEERFIPKIIFGLGESGIWITDIEVKKPTLEDFFLQMARKDKYVNSNN
ncbi:MAG: ABC transporter ATP-binding protein [Candidatus Levybacteria bacterium]|nr:ABC transporter ATP-binding protein [Candidatus Levybacteria bacterium]